MNELFEIIMEVGGVLFEVCGYKNNSCAEEIISVRVLTKDNVYSPVIFDKEKFLKDFEDYINDEIREAEEDCLRAHEDLMFDTFREEEYFKRMEEGEND